jgi:hypothetical protein
VFAIWGSRNGSVGIATGLLVLFPAGTKDSSPLYRVQTGFGAHPASYLTSTTDFSSGVKRQEREADHSSPSSAEIKNDGAIPPLHHMPL